MNKNPINILIVTESVDVNDSSASKGRVALIKNLHYAGFVLKVYHYTRKQIELPDIECVSIKEQKGTLWYGLSKLQLLLKRLTNWNINNQIEKLWGFSFAHFNDTFSIKKALEKEDPMQYDWILTLSKAASFRPHKALLGIPKWHKKWLAYVHDPYPMHSYPRPYDWVEPGHQMKRDFFLQVADKCRYAVYPSQLLGEWMESYYQHLKGKAVVIPHQINGEIKGEEGLPPYFKEKTFTILHAGSLLWGRDPNGLIMGFQQFLNSNPDAKHEAQLVFLGSKNHYSQVLKMYAEKINQLYISEDYVPFEQVYQMQLKAAVNVILEAKGPVSPFLPGKFPHCVAADKPILLLCPQISESKRLLGNTYRYAAEIDDEEQISELITELYTQWKLSPDKLLLNKPDLKDYLSENYLFKTIQKLSPI